MPGHPTPYAAMQGVSVLMQLGEKTPLPTHCQRRSLSWSRERIHLIGRFEIRRGVECRVCKSHRGPARLPELWRLFLQTRSIPQCRDVARGAYVGLALFS